MFALTNSSTDLTAPDIKRRRLEEKQPPSIAYQRLEQEQQVSKLVTAAQAGCSKGRKDVAH